jgi:hypothetical protein
MYWKKKLNLIKERDKTSKDQTTSEGERDRQRENERLKKKKKDESRQGYRIAQEGIKGTSWDGSLHWRAVSQYWCISASESRLPVLCQGLLAPRWLPSEETSRSSSSSSKFTSSSSSSSVWNKKFSDVFKIKQGIQI